MDPVQFLRQGILGNFKPQLPAGFLLQVVRLVDNHPLVVPQHGAAHRQIGQQQGMVHDQNVRPVGLLPRPAQETGRAFAAPEGRADALGVGADARPGPAVAGLHIELRAVAVRGVVQPHGSLADDARFILAQSI